MQSLFQRLSSWRIKTTPSLTKTYITGLILTATPWIVLGLLFTSLTTIFLIFKIKQNYINQLNNSSLINSSTTLHKNEKEDKQLRKQICFIFLFILALYFTAHTAIYLSQFIHASQTTNHLLQSLGARILRASYAFVDLSTFTYNKLQTLNLSALPISSQTTPSPEALADTNIPIYRVISDYLATAYPPTNLLLPPLQSLQSLLQTIQTTSTKITTITTYTTYTALSLQLLTLYLTLYLTTFTLHHPIPNKIYLFSIWTFLLTLIFLFSILISLSTTLGVFLSDLCTLLATQLPSPPPTQNLPQNFTSATTPQETGPPRACILALCCNNNTSPTSSTPSSLQLQKLFSSVLNQNIVTQVFFQIIGVSPKDGKESFKFLSRELGVLLGCDCFLGVLEEVGGEVCGSGRKRRGRGSVIGGVGGVWISLVGFVVGVAGIVLVGIFFRGKLGDSW